MSESIQLSVNGEMRQLANNATITDLLADMGLAGKRVAVEVNEEIVPRSQHPAFNLSSDDTVEVVQAIGGG